MVPPSAHAYGSRWMERKRKRKALTEVRKGRVRTMRMEQNESLVKDRGEVQYWHTARVDLSREFHI